MLRSGDLARLEEDLPGYRHVHSFAAALPFYECDCEVRMLVRHELSALQQYSLACIAKNVDFVDAIDVVLGAGRAAITNAMASLLGADLIRPRAAKALGGDERFVPTDKGAIALTELGWRKPELVPLRVLYDGLTGELIAPNRLLYINPGEAAKTGLHVIPSRCSAPTLGDVDFVALRRVVREMRKQDARRVPDGELHDLIKIGSRKPAYRGCEVAAFEGPDGTVVFRVLDRGKRLMTYEDVLTAMFPSQPEILPFERDVALTLPKAISALIPPDLLAKAEELDFERDRLVEAIQARHEEQQVETRVIGGPAETATEVVFPASPTTRDERDSLRKRLEEVERERDSVRNVATYEHRELLEKALKHARHRVIIVSPWLSHTAINDDLQKLMRKALQRGVEIVIGWGIPPEEGNEKAARRDEKSLSMLRQLERLGKQARAEAEEWRTQRAKRLSSQEAAAASGLSPAEARAKTKTTEVQPGVLRVVRLGDTHEKILIADLQSAVVTSFNFLSFRGDPKRGFRRETGIFYAVKARVEELAADVLARIERVEQEATPGDTETAMRI
jgi:hypothetical protein